MKNDCETDIPHFFTTGIFAKGKSLIALIFSCILFTCSLTAFSVALTATLADTELTSLRRLYACKKEYVTVVSSETGFYFKHGFRHIGFDSDDGLKTELFFSQRQLDILREYDNSIAETKDEYGNVISVTFRLSGDYSKDKQLFKKLKYQPKEGVLCLRGVDITNEGFASDSTWKSLHLGAGLTDWEAALLFVGSAISLTTAIALLKRHCKKSLLPQTDPCEKTDTKQAATPRKTVLLQALFLMSVLFFASLCFSHSVFPIINARRVYISATEYAPMTRALIPEAIPTLITLALSFLSVFLPPLCACKKPRQERRKQKCVKK